MTEFGETLERRFDRAGCIGHTIAKHQTFMTPGSLGGNIERRYIDSADLRSTDAPTALGGIYSVDTIVRDRLEALQNSPAGISNEDLQMLIDQGAEVHVAFGAAILERAQQENLVAATEPSEIASSSWLIREDGAGRPFLLIARTDETLLEIDLDALSRSSEDFLPEQIKRFYTTRELAYAAHTIQHRLALHEFPHSTNFLVGLTYNHERRHDDMQAIVRFHDWMAHLPHIEQLPANLVWRLNRKIFDSVTNIDGHDLDQMSYLLHMAECPTRRPFTQELDRDLLGLLGQLQRISPQNPPMLPLPKKAFVEILAQPDKHLLEDREAELENNVKETRIGQDIIRRSARTRNGDEVRRILATDFPEYYETLVQLDARLAHKIGWSAEEYLSSAPLPLTDQKLQQTKETLFSPLETVLEEPGYFEDHPQLSLLIPLLFAKQRGAPQIIEQLRQQQDLAHTQAGRALNKESSRITLRQTFLDDANISNDEIERLVDIGTQDATLNPALFLVAFNALYLHRRGHIDMKSPAFETYVNDLMQLLPGFHIGFTGLIDPW